MSTSGPHHGPRQCPRVDISEVHLSGPLKFVSQMSIFRVLHAWTISKSTRGDLFPAGLRTAGRGTVQYIYGGRMTLCGTGSKRFCARDLEVKST